MKKTIRFAIFVVLLIASFNSFSSTYVVSGTKITVFSQSHKESTAHLIQLGSPMFNGGNHPWCINRAYILFDDKELFASALSASVSNKAVNLIYEDAAESKMAAGHSELSCKVISIWY